MLKQLTIRNLAIINDINIDFSDGLTMLLGETGAGKSIVIDALSLITRDRASSDLIGPHGDRAIIIGVFAVDSRMANLLDEFFGFHDELVTIQRTIEAQKSSLRVNGQLTTLNIVRQLTEPIIDIHSQHQNQYLLDDSNHITLLDSFLFDSIKAPLEAYQTCYLKLMELERKRNQMIKFHASQPDRQHLEDQLALIREIDLQPDEIETLTQAAHDLNHYSEIANLFNEVDTAFSEHVLDHLYHIYRALEALSKHPQFGQFAPQVNDCYYTLKEVASELRANYEALDYQPGRLDEINMRLYQISKLQRHFGNNYEEILSAEQTLREQIDCIDDFDYELAKIEVEIIEARAEAEASAAVLTELRQRGSIQLINQIQAEAEALFLNNLNFVIEITPTSLHPDGTDHVVYHLSLNPDLPPRPLAKVISGGELSRVMLIFKLIFARLYGTRILIFDEIDNGVSGRVADALGKRLKELASDLQVIVVTHLLPVAANGQHFILVQKDESGRVAIQTLESHQAIVNALMALVSADAGEDAYVLVERLYRK